eukprot:9393376-Alexandrium_andersonii.AAC.1
MCIRDRLLHRQAQVPPRVGGGRDGRHQRGRLPWQPDRGRQCRARASLQALTCLPSCLAR